MAVEVVHVGADLEPVVARQRRRVDARPGDDDHAQAGTRCLGLGVGGDHPPQQVGADAGAADGDDADLLVGAVAELGAQRVAVGELCRVEAGDVAGEVEVLLGPVADQRAGPGRSESGTMSSAVADEDRPVPDPRVAGDVLDHLGVVVGGEERLVVAAVGHRQPADEVGQPAVGGALLLRVLVQEVVELPRLVADPQVVVLLADDVVEDHEVGDEDLVHPPPRLEAVQVVLGRLGLDVAATRWPARRWPGGSRSPFGLEHGGDRVLRQPVDLRDRGGACAARRRWRRRAGRGRARSARRRRARACGGMCRAPSVALAERCRPERFGELAEQQVHLHRDRGHAEGGPDPASVTSVPARALGEIDGPPMPAIASSSPRDDEHRAATRPQQSSTSGRPPVIGRASESGCLRLRGQDQRLGADLQSPADAVLDLLRRVRLGERLRPEEVEEARGSRAASSGGCTSPTPRRCRARRRRRGGDASRSTARTGWSGR